MQDSQFQVAQVIIGGTATAQTQAEQKQPPPAEEAPVILDHRLVAGIGQLIQPTERIGEEVADGFEEEFE
jgi:hypothetical protein